MTRVYKLNIAWMNDENVIEKFFARGNSYWLTRFVILRLLGFVYAVAFFVQPDNCAVDCHRGLTPADFYLRAFTQSSFAHRRILHLPAVLVRVHRPGMSSSPGSDSRFR